ncbi:nucleic-acid-binding protein from transposon X-element [Trichonephila clavipes]|nr:nucleic-acid-binding protein from transposon X-element [Trichonephila clavipes]
MSGRNEASSDERSMDLDNVDPTFDLEQHCAFIRAQEKEIAYSEVRLSYINNVISIEKKDTRDTCTPAVQKLEDERREIMEKLKKTQASRPQKIVLKGLPTSTDIQNIKSDLENQGYIVEKVAQLTKNKTKSPLPIFMVEIKKFPNSADANKINKCCYMTFSVDTFRNRPGPSQCYNCNYFHHSSKNCFIKTRCLKCGQPHKTNECLITYKIENPTCINCNTNGHMAKWHECPKFPKTKPKKGAAAQNRNVKNNQNSFHSNANLIKKDFSYTNSTQKAQQRAALDGFKSVQTEPEPAKTQTENKKPPRDNIKNNKNNDDNLREFKILFQEFPYFIETGKTLRNAEKHEKVDNFYQYAFT